MSDTYFCEKEVLVRKWLPTQVFTLQKPMKQTIIFWWMQELNMNTHHAYKWSERHLYLLWKISISSQLAANASFHVAETYETNYHIFFFNTPINIERWYVGWQVPDWRPTHVYDLLFSTRWPGILLNYSILDEILWECLPWSSLRIFQ